ncbi:MAG: EscR/YscR/HrcR family type III secretion system export apparatus protein, partial [Burkholderiaceae bacterium]
MTNLPDPGLIVGTLVLLGLLPFFVVLATSYTKIVIVLGLLRLALGIQQTPPNMVLNAVAIVLTVFIMAPVGAQSYEALVKEPKPQKFGQRFEDLVQTVQTASDPFRQFLKANTREREKRLFMKAAADLWPKPQAQTASPDDLMILLPSFTLSELTQAFQIGF